MNLTIHHHGQHVLAIDPVDGMVNASMLVKRFGQSVEEYLLLDGTQPTLVSIAERNGHPLPTQWHNNQIRARHKPDFLRTLAAAGIIRQVAGTVGGHAAAAPGAAGNGIRNHSPGLWLHPALAVDLARLAEIRGETWRPSPLAEFVEQALAGRDIDNPCSLDGAAPKSAADSFAGMVDAQTLANLRRMDQILTDGGLSFSERHQTLQARLEQQAPREG
ncbi:hypothetical protein [Pseudomonas sp. UBA2684]|uniref:hypothetical protein n=1 Tax=Pseudomonas sp. UBA2684 TaxID=1947311 RepID=UPI0025F06870|nr:hypothetical protein [Pseudomonas sp. UBA2684]|tara:strand:+ start:2129 stop:2782 length:654 start_codon:yes stop_codon:yes gene_type:complete